MLKILKFTMENVLISENIHIKNYNFDFTRPLYVVSETEEIAKNFILSIVENHRHPAIYKANNISILDFEPSRFEIASFSDFLKKLNKSNLTTSEFLAQALSESKLFNENFEVEKTKNEYLLNTTIFKANGATAEELAEYNNTYNLIKDGIDPLFEHAYAKYNFVFDDYEYKLKLVKEYKETVKPSIFNPFKKNDDAFYKGIPVKELKKMMSEAQKKLLTNPILKQQVEGVKLVKETFKNSAKNHNEVQNKLINKYGSNYKKNDQNTIEFIQATESNIKTFKEHINSQIEAVTKVWKFDENWNTAVSQLSTIQKFKLFLIYLSASKSQLKIRDYVFQNLKDETDEEYKTLWKLSIEQGGWIVYSTNLNDEIKMNSDLLSLTKNEFNIQFNRHIDNMILNNETLKRWGGKND